MPAGDWVAAVGRSTLALCGDAGRLVLTAIETTGRMGRSFLPGERFRFRSAVRETFLAGALALPIVSLIAFMMGLTLAFQSAYQLERFGATIYVANLVAVALTRELGPVITAIVVAGRSGSAIAAEIASMQVQEELDALKVMGLNPVAFLVVPMMVGMLVALPLLTALADLVGIGGGLLCAVGVLGIDAHRYLDHTREALVMKDFVSGLMKAVMFSGIIVSVGAFCGFNVTGGAEGVARATTRSVVLSIFLVIVSDLIFTGLFYSYG